MRRREFITLESGHLKLFPGTDIIGTHVESIIITSGSDFRKGHRYFLKNESDRGWTDHRRAVFPKENALTATLAAFGKSGGKKAPGKDRGPRSRLRNVDYLPSCSFAAWIQSVPRVTGPSLL